MKPLQHARHILEKNNIILVPAFFHVILVQTILSYTFNAIKPPQDFQAFLQSIGTMLPMFLWLALISGALILIIDSFFTSLTLSMVFEAWKKGRTKLDWSYGITFFRSLLVARLAYFAIAALLFISFAPISLLAVGSPLLGGFLMGTALLLSLLFFFSFFWLNESIVTKRLNASRAFAYSAKTTLKNFLLTLHTFLLTVALYFISTGIISIFSPLNQIFLTTLVTLLFAILLKALVSIIKIVFFLQAKQ